MLNKVFYNENELKFEKVIEHSLFLDKTGMKFGILTVLGYAGKAKSNHATWYCKCECGNVVKVAGTSLTTNNTSSCGCLLIESRIKNATHGHSRDLKVSPTYKAWQGMLSRCNNKNNPNYPSYGGRGIKVCDRWLKFENFLADMGCRPIGKTIDRYPDNNGGYHPTNCRWATPKEQANNRRSNNIISFDGEEKTIEQWSECLGISRTTLWCRIFRDKWPVDTALTTPVKIRLKKEVFSNP